MTSTPRGINLPQFKSANLLAKNSKQLRNDTRYFSLQKKILFHQSIVLWH